jgi:hypothetical protein
MSLSYLYSTPLVIACIFTMSLAGCQIEERELLSWQTDDHGHLKIASYITDPQRPIESRKKSIAILAKGRHYDDIMSVYQHLLKLEGNGEAEAAFFTDELLVYIDKTLTNKSPEKKTIAAELSFFLMSLEGPRAKIADRHDLIEKLTKWSLNYLRTNREVIVPSARAGASQVKEALIKPEDVLLSLLHITSAKDNSQAVFDLVKKDLNENLAKSEYILRVHRVVHDLRNASITEQMAVALLGSARKTYPESITIDMVEGMIENQNETLLRYLIEINRDRRVDYSILKLAIDKAADKSFDMGLNAEMLPILRRVLSSTNAHAKIIFRALRWSWEFGTKDDLKESLKSINPNFSAPVSGTDMKKEVENFCVQFVETKKDKVREPLLELLEELKDKPELWPARLYTLSCITALYPDDFPRVMKKGGLYKRYYSKDKKRISAWRSDRDVTMGEITTEYMNPLR